MNYEGIKKVNATIKKVPIKGKDYAMVNDRVLGFRQICPNGTIDTEILSNVNGVCIIKATVYDESGHQLGSGIACEKESSSFINKTSYIENCETSAIGRALGSCGIGCDDNYCTADEIGTAIGQGHINEQQVKVLNSMLDMAKGRIDPKKLFGKPVEQIRMASYNQACKLLSEELSKLGIE